MQNPISLECSIQKGFLLSLRLRRNDKEAWLVELGKVWAMTSGDATYFPIPSWTACFFRFQFAASPPFETVRIGVRLAFEDIRRS